MTTTSDHLEQFRRVFPLTDVIVYEDRMNYRFKNLMTARYFESRAQEIIMENHLRLVAALGIWEKGGYIFELSLKVEYAPEAYLIER